MYILISCYFGLFNIIMDFQEAGWGTLNWIDLAKSWDRWRTVVDVIRNLWFCKMQGISCLAEDLLTSQEGLCSM
jgi:hypothetical protein